MIWGSFNQTAINLISFIINHRLHVYISLARLSKLSVFGRRPIMAAAYTSKRNKKKKRASFFYGFVDLWLLRSEESRAALTC